MEMKKKKCKNNCSVSKSNGNGKGDSPRSNFSKKFQSNYESINWSKPKKTKNKS